MSLLLVRGGVQIILEDGPGDELVVAGRVVQRISEQGFGEYSSLAPARPEEQRILAIVRDAAGPVKVQGALR